MTFPSSDKLADELYFARDDVSLHWLCIFSQNMWEGFCNFNGKTSGHEVTAIFSKTFF